jgi:hypothetical protein
VVLRYAFNPLGDRDLKAESVEEERVAVSHWAGPASFSGDWKIWQKSSEKERFGAVPYLEFHRYATGFGFLRPPAGAKFEDMKEAPQAGYKCENQKAVKGLILYCRVNDNRREGLGYGKILVEDVTETPPAGVRIIERE